MENTFNKNLAIFRKQKGLSQRELAKLIGTTHRMIAYYENETNSIPLDKLEKLAEVLNVSTADLITPIKNKKDLAKNIYSTDVRLFKKIQEIKNLPDRDQRSITNHIEALIEKNKNKEKQLTESVK